MPAQKELHFFDRPGFDDPERRRWYGEQFDDRPERVVGEATPAYLHTAVAAERMASYIPDARLIALLREPVDRAVSHYWYARSINHDTRDIDDALFAADDAPGLPYLSAGRYFENLQRLLDHFPRESLLVELFDNVVEQPATLFAEVCAFLGVDGTVVPDSVGKAFNTHYRLRAPRVRSFMIGRRVYDRWPRVAQRIDDLLRARSEYPPLTSDQRKRLEERFVDDNAKLAAWLGRDLPGWTCS